MNKEKGYKQTKLGWIPEDWNVCTFADIANKKVKWSITGGPFGSNLKAEHYREEGVRIIQLQNIGDGEFRDISKIYTSKDKADELIACNIFAGEIILSKMGDPVARACNIPNTEKRWVMGSDGIRLVVDESQYDKRFVLDYINYSIFRNLAISRSTGSTRRRIGLVDLKKIPFIKLPLPEQQKIANILNTWDKAIATQEKLITEKQKLKKGLMQQLLTGKKRFTGFEEKWKEVKIKEIAKTFSGGTPSSKKSEYYDGDIPWLKSGELNKGIIKSTGGFISQLGLKNSSAKLVSIDTILVAMYGATAGVCAISKIKGAINQAVLALILKENIDTYFLYQLLKMKMPHIVHAMVQGGQPNLSGGIINNVKLYLPDFIEQKKISKVLQKRDNEISTIQEKLKQLKFQKQGLMQQLLTGEKRVKI